MRILSVTHAGLAAIVTTLLLAAAPARADVDKGADSFDANCAECHSLATPPRNKKGPSLVGVFGRSAATVPGYEYSDAMKNSKITWTRDQLDAYIKLPKAAVPGGKMKFDGLSDAKERSDLIDFLETRK